MSGRLAVPLAVVALMLAAGLALLARDVRRWQQTMASDDVRFVVAPVERALWSGPSGVDGRLARRLLGVDDDVRFRRAERLFVRGHVPASTFALETSRLAALGGARELLEEVAAADASPGRRARAANLLGLVLFEDAQSDREHGPALVRQALARFRDAARADPSADEARFNLELVLSLLRQGQRQGRAPGGTQASGGGGVGAGLIAPGGGY